MERKNLIVGMRVTIPMPQDDDTWDAAMITDVDDIMDDGTVIFMDDDYVEHEIEVSRIQIYTA